MQIVHIASKRASVHLLSSSIFNPCSAKPHSIHEKRKGHVNCIALGADITSPPLVHVPFWFNWIDNPFGRETHFQFCNQPLVISKLYPRAKLNIGKSIKIEKAEVQAPAEVSEKTNILSVPRYQSSFPSILTIVRGLILSKFPQWTSSTQLLWQKPDSHKPPDHNQQSIFNCCFSGVQHSPQLCRGSHCCRPTLRAEIASHYRRLIWRPELPQVWEFCPKKWPWKP